MNVTGVVFTLFKTHLTDGFQEWQGLNVTDRAAHLNNGNVRAFCAAFNARFNFVGNVRNDLYGFT